MLHVQNESVAAFLKILPLSLYSFTFDFICPREIIQKSLFQQKLVNQSLCVFNGGQYMIAPQKRPSFEWKTIRVCGYFSRSFLSIYSHVRWNHPSLCLYFINRHKEGWFHLLGGTKNTAKMRFPLLYPL